MEASDRSDVVEETSLLVVGLDGRNGDDVTKALKSSTPLLYSGLGIGVMIGAMTDLSAGTLLFYFWDELR